MIAALIASFSSRLAVPILIALGVSATLWGAYEMGRRAGAADERAEAARAVVQQSQERANADASVGRVDDPAARLRRDWGRR